MPSDETIVTIREHAELLLDPGLQKYKRLLKPSLQSCLEILDILKDGKQHTSTEIQDAIGINANTVRCYCRAMQDAGLPLHSGARAGWILYRSDRKQFLAHFTKS